MILSEEQAKTRRCQESFGQFYVTSNGNSMMAMAGYGGGGYALQASPSHCIGSGCMAWRWYDGEPESNEPSCRGYCGKAGRPSP